MSTADRRGAWSRMSIDRDRERFERAEADKLAKNLALIERWAAWLKVTYGEERPMTEAAAEAHALAHVRIFLGKEPPQ